GGGADSRLLRRSGLGPPRPRAAAVRAMPRGCPRRGVPPLRAHGHAARRTALSDARLRGGRANRALAPGWRVGAARPHVARDLKNARSAAQALRGSTSKRQRGADERSQRSWTGSPTTAEISSSTAWQAVGSPRTAVA